MEQNEKELQEFVMWLPKSGIKEFSEKSPEEVVSLLNKMSKEKDGEQIINTLLEQYQTSKSGESEMFKKGGKLTYLTELYKKGGVVKKCKCGCTMKKVMEKGGVIEKCSCGCKGIGKKEDGGKLKTPASFPKKDTTKVSPILKSKVDNSPERTLAKKQKSEFYTPAGKKGKWDTESGLPIMKKGGKTFDKESIKKLKK